MDIVAETHTTLYSGSLYHLYLLDHRFNECHHLLKLGRASLVLTHLCQLDLLIMV